MAVAAHSWAITVPPTEAPSAESASSFHTRQWRYRSHSAANRPGKKLSSPLPPRSTDHPLLQSQWSPAPLKKNSLRRQPSRLSSPLQRQNHFGKKYRKRSGLSPQRTTTLGSLTIRQALRRASLSHQNSRAFIQRRWLPNLCSPGRQHRPITPLLPASGASRAQSGWISGSTTRGNSASCRSAKVRELLSWTRPRYRPLPVGNSCLTG